MPARHRVSPHNNAAPPPGASHSTITMRSFHPAATAGIFVAGALLQMIHAQTGGCWRGGAHSIGSGPYAG